MAAGAIIRLSGNTGSEVQAARTTTPEPRQQESGEASRMVLTPNGTPAPAEQPSATQEMQKALSPAATPTP
jgi:hypothetical protein